MSKSLLVKQNTEQFQIQLVNQQIEEKLLTLNSNNGLRFKNQQSSKVKSLRYRNKPVKKKINFYTRKKQDRKIQRRMIWTRN
jgi:hypothetical protein